MTLISVHPADLRAAAAQIDNAAALVAHCYQGPGRELAVARHPAWSTQTELVSAGHIWTSYLSGLRKAVQGSARALRTVADSYAASESDAAHAQRRGGGGYFA